MAFQGSQLAYDVQVDSSSLRGPARLSVSADGLALTTASQRVLIPYAHLTAFTRQGYALQITTDDERYTCSGFGALLEPFILELTTVYNQAVLKGLFVGGEPSLVAEGDFRYQEADRGAQGRAILQVYDNCLCILPPDDQARRVPFVFVSDLVKGNFELTLVLASGERYTLARLGANTDPFETCIRGKLHTLQQNALDAIQRLDARLDPSQLTAIAHLMPHGVAAPIGALAAISPAYVGALEHLIGDSSAAEEYLALKQICDPDQICVGIRPGFDQPNEALWFIAPSSTKPVAAVEWATSEDEAAATFIYSLQGDQATFVAKINQAMEAIAFRREVITIAEEKLRDLANAEYYLAIRRTRAVQLLRSALTGRVIHSSLQTWTNQIRTHLT
ncbi:MAG: hypothetical protein LBE83_04040 [Propionibacteriaceae bacterium]|jgi:hypothetical protein|nr:hypothetical protein [Propionibacteriaceae bacterium]